MANSYLTKTGEPSADIFDLEQDVIAKLNIFNSTYAEFIRCNSTNTYINKTNCPTSPVNPHQSQLNVNDAIARLSNALQDINHNSDSPVQYDASYNEITNNYKNVQQLRASLDLKMKDLENEDKSLSHIYQSKTDATVYAGILWTVLASSLVYYVFVKL